jgi:hypothetical protein
MLALKLYEGNPPYGILGGNVGINRSPFRTITLPASGGANRETRDGNGSN